MTNQNAAIGIPGRSRAASLSYPAGVSTATSPTGQLLTCTNLAAILLDLAKPTGGKRNELCRLATKRYSNRSPVLTSRSM